ncbi:hypothetical protein, partial [Salmonella enterica]|uniref:hypothetical protein n=1 Tax=Salmonella enterica TaxID=28901 RepID=UPI001119626E
DQEVQLQPPLILVLNPQHAVLVFIESGHQNPFKARHQLFALPKTKQEAAQAITRGLLALASSGELKTRQDVTEALESAGFE